MKLQISEQQALRHLANELDARDKLLRMQKSRAYHVIRAGGRAIHCLLTPVLVSEIDQRIYEARKQLHDLQAPLAGLYGLKGPA